MFNLAQVLAAREHYDDLIREAGHRRLVRQIANKPTRHNVFYSKTLAWIGRQLTKFGWHLVNRYGDVSALSPRRMKSDSGRMQLSRWTGLDCLCKCTDCHGTISNILPDVL